jgi:hypothetical protein
MKYCPHCKHLIQRWGMTAAGTKRYFCPSCKRTITAGKRAETRERKLLRELLLIVDATYIHRNQLCVLVAIDEKDRIYWRFATHESYQAWYEFLGKFPKPNVVVMDGQKGLYLAAQRLWPFTAIQPNSMSSHS